MGKENEIMMQDYSRIANLFGGSGVDPKKRKEILKMVERLCNMYQDADSRATKTARQYQELLNRNRDLEKKLAEAVTGKPDFGKYAYLVESESYKKLEKIREIVKEDFDWEEFYGEDN